MAHELAASLVLDQSAGRFPLPFDPRATSLPGWIGGKASRFLARNWVTKGVVMCNSQPLVTFTFDDVPVSACSIGAAILESHRVRATFYVSGGGCGAWSPSGPLATAPQLRAVAASGHELGCQTYSHPAVCSISAATLEAELERNRKFLASVSGEASALNFAYPYGALSFAAKRRLENHFHSCRSVVPGVNAGTVDLGALRACALEDRALDRAGIAELIAATVRAKGWLIFYSHDVEKRPSRFGVSPDRLAYAVSAAKAAGCRVATVAAALRSVTGENVAPALDPRARLPVPTQTEPCASGEPTGFRK